jgi:hypothetical protein
MGSMPVRRGVHRPLEDAADRIIKESLVGTTSRTDKSDILTPWKAQSRRAREVLVPIADSTIRRGTFGRVLNTQRPELNSREGSYPARQGMSPRGSLAQFVDDFGGTSTGDFE